MLYRDDPSLDYGLMADLRPGVGVVTLWSTGYSVTPEGIGSGSSADEIAAAYPDASGDELAGRRRSPATRIARTGSTSAATTWSRA